MPTISNKSFGDVAVRFLLLLAMNLWAYPLLVIWTLTGIVIFVPVFLLWKVIVRWPSALIMQFFMWVYARICMLILRPFIRIKFEGFSRDNMPCPGIFVLNHFSFIDTYLLGYLPVFNIHVGLRAWPFRMLWYGFFMRLAGFVNLEDSSWDNIKVEAKNIFAHNRYLLIFPEGHRSRTGKIMRFYSGAFKLAVENNIPIIPMCISGTRDLLPPHRWWFEPAIVRIRILEPVIDLDEFQEESGHIELRKRIRKQMIDAIDDMRRD